MSPASEDPPVSVKAALRCDGKWVLLKNDRDEWELPGGRIDATDESLEQVVRRECHEELGVEVTVGALVSAYLFEVVKGRRVTIVCFAAEVAADAEMMHSEEHTEFGLFSIDELAELALPPGYRSAILRAASS